MPKQNSTMIDAGLKKIGFGGLSDPTLFDQIAFVVSGHGPKEGHARFLSLLMSAEPEQRKVAYDAIAPKLRFKALPLDDYIRIGREEADRKHLPTYHKDSLIVEDWKPQEITTQDYIQNFMRTGEAPDAPKMLLELHESASRDRSEKETQSGILGLIEESKPKTSETSMEERVTSRMRDEDNDAMGKYLLTLACSSCTLQRQWKHLTHREALQTAVSDGWTVKDWSPAFGGLAPRTMCPACKKARFQ